MLRPALALLAAALLLAACGKGGGEGMRAGAELGCDGVGPATEHLPGARSVNYAESRGGRPLRVHVIPAQTGEGPRPAILLFFGGGWRNGDVSSLESQARAFAAKGYVAVLADYRVRCRDGTTPLDSATDAKRAYRWLREHAGELGVDPDRIVLAGGSAGGQMALYAAQKAKPGEKPAALILFNPAVDLVTPAPWWQKPFARGISPASLPVAGLPPTTIFHGETDRTVPIASVRAFCDKAWKAGTICVVHGYAGRGHGFYHSRKPGPAGGPSPYDDTLARSLDFLERTAITDPGRRPQR